MGNITAIYVSSSQFTVSGDKEQEFADNGNRKVTLKQGVDGQARVSVTASSYSAVTGLTTVTVSPSSVTANLATVEPGATDRFSTAGHTHLDADDGGLIHAATFSESQVSDLKTMPPLGAGDTLKLLRINSDDDSYEAVDIMGSVGNRFVGVNAAGDDFERKNLVGTTNQVTVTHTPGQTTLGTPQNLHTSAYVEFARVYTSDFLYSYGDLTVEGTIYLPGEDGILVADGAYGVGSTRDIELDSLTIPSLSGVLVSDGGYGVSGDGALGDLADVDGTVSGSGAAGDILVRDADSYERLPIGSDTNVLQVSSGAPVWGELDGDKLDIDWDPSNYTPDSSPSEADDVDDLTAHLRGIDDTLANCPTDTDSSTWDASTGATWTDTAPASVTYVERYWYTAEKRVKFHLDISTSDGDGKTPVSFVLPVTPIDDDTLMPVQAIQDINGTITALTAYIDCNDGTAGNRKLILVGASAWTDTTGCRVSVSGEYEIS